MTRRAASLFDTATWRKIVDAGVVAFVVLLGLGSLIALRKSGGADVYRPLALAGVAIALLYRHRQPPAALGAILVIAAFVNYSPIVLLPALIGVLTVATDSPPRIIAPASVITAVVLAGDPLLHGHALATTSDYVSRIVAVGLALAFGLFLRARADYVGGLQEAAVRLKRERELLATQAVADERVRIARELHDVVAHNVSLMVVSAQAAAAAGELDDGQRATLGRIGDLGRDALSEMHRMLGVLRVGDDGEAERAPQPGVRDLAQLVASTRQAGLDARLEVTGAPRELPAGVDLSAYRIVQEALTNVIRHAAAHHAEVTLRYGSRALELTVLDDGLGTLADNGNGDGRSGHGLVGMRERVALFGGELLAAPRTDGPGFRVHARLPLR